MPSLGRILERLTVAVDADTSEAERGLNDLSNESKGGSWVGKLGGASSKAGAAVAFGIGGGVAAIAGLGLASAVSAEQSMIAFTSIMGDAGKAKSFLADLSAFAAKTPFELPELKDAASRMLAVGTESSRVIPIMTALGNSTSAMGTGSEGINRAVTALTQMQTKGKVTGEEMLQLAEAGVPAWDALATVMGVSVAEAQKKVSTGQVEANTLFKALETNAGPSLQRVTGMMDKQSESAAGMLSTLKDTAMQGLGDMMAPALVALKGALPQITTVMGDMIKTMGPAVAGMVPAFIELFKALADMLPGLMDGLKQLLPVVTSVLGAFTWLLDKIPPGIILGVVAAFMALGPVVSIFSALATVLPILLGPIGLVVLAVAALALAGYAIYKHWDSIAAFFDGIWEWIKTTFANGVEAVGRFLGNMVDFFLAVPRRVVEALGDLGLLLFRSGINLVKGLWDGINAMWGAFWGFVTGIPGEIVRGIGDLAQTLVHAGKNAVIGLWNGLASMGSWLWDRVTGFAKDFVSGAIDWALKIFSPSKEMEWRGRMVGTGLADGIERSTPVVAAAARAMADEVKSIMAEDGSMVAPSFYAPVAALAAAPPPVMAVPAVRGPGPGMVMAEDGSYVPLSFYARATVAAPSSPPPATVSFDGMTMTMDEMRRRLRVLFIDDGARNATYAATG